MQNDSPTSERPARSAHRPDTRETGLFLVACVLAILPLWIVTYPPLVDLPQHAAQIELLRTWDDPACFAPGELDRTLLTPYALGPLLGWALATWFPVLVAVKILLSLTVLATVLAFRRLVHRVDGPAEWCFLGLLVAWSPAMQWGLLPFVVAVPIALLTLDLAIRQLDVPTVGRAVSLVLLSLVLLIAHGLALVLTIMATLGIAAGRASSLRHAAVALASWLPVVPVGWLWVTGLRDGSGAHRDNPVFETRIFELFSWLVGADDRWPWVLAGAAVFVCAFAGRRLGSSPRQWLVLLAFVLLVLFAPSNFMGTGLIAERMMVFAFPLLVVLSTTPAQSTGWWQQLGRRRRHLLPLLTVALLSTSILRAALFERESADFRRVLESAEPGHRAMSLVFDPTSRWAWYEPYMHFPQWYSLSGGCMVEMSFASYFAPMVRFEDAKTRPLQPGFEWTPENFHWEGHDGDRYRYFFLRSLSGERPESLRDDGRTRIVGESGAWTLLERAEASSLP